MTTTRLPSPALPVPSLPGPTTRPNPSQPDPLPTTRPNPARLKSSPTAHAYPSHALPALPDDPPRPAPTPPAPTTHPGPSPAVPDPTTHPAPRLIPPPQPDNPTRDYASEMTAVIDAEIGDGPYVSAVVALHLVEKLRATDAALLAGWLDLQAVGILRDAISSRSRSEKAHARATRGRSVFREAAESGDVEALTGFLNVRYVADEANTRIRLADMRRPELLFAADDYKRQAAENLLEEAFLRALARKVRSGRVSDHFSEDQLAQMWRSVSGGN